MSRRKYGKCIGKSATVAGAAFIGMCVLAKKKKPASVYDDKPAEKNPFEGKKVILIENAQENADGVKSCLKAEGESVYNPGVYDKYVKRGIDILLSFGGLVALSPVMGAIALAIRIEDPGPVLFTQKRLGKNKQYFKLHKFRSMKVGTPHDIPTHQLGNPDQYITKVGRFLRAHSLDELPQIWDIFIGNMSVIGPRPGLWNQDFLVAERDKYGANDVKPGLTGWAQINGRDELEIPIKAKYDGEYVEKESLIFDIKCFLKTISKIRHDDSVIEGNCSKKKRVGRFYTNGKSAEELTGQIGFGEPVVVDRSACRKVLIVGAGSYVGDMFRVYAKKNYTDNFIIDTVGTINGEWKEQDFSSYDIVYHVAGIAHVDACNVPNDEKERYYVVNTDLAVEVAEKAKEEGVREFIFMSSMIIYGEAAPYGKKKVVDEHTVPIPVNFYGDSKLQADVGVRTLADESFKVIVLRPPMIYGKGSKGNYQTLSQLAKKFPVFPDVDNERSMLHIDNFCEFLSQIMLIKRLKENAVVLIPQNDRWTKTSEMAKEIAAVNKKKCRQTTVMRPVVSIVAKLPGKIGGMVNKAFGSSCYAHSVSRYEGLCYHVVNFEESIKRTESKNVRTIWIIDHYSSEPQYGGISRQYDFARELAGKGYCVVVFASAFSHFTHTYIGENEVFINQAVSNVYYVYLRTSGYQSNNGIRRAENMVDFMFQVLRHESRIAAKYGKPDVVTGCSVHPLAWIAAYRIARKYDIRFCAEVRDFWPRIWVVAGEKKTTDPMVMFFHKVEKWAYKNADRIIYSMSRGDQYICGELGIESKKTFMIGQPMDCERFDLNKEKIENLPQEIREFMKDSFVCSFAGYYMTYEGVYVMLKAAKILKDRNIPVKMVFVGSGQEKDGMLSYVESEQLDHVLICDRIPKEAVPALLGSSEVCMAHLEVKGHKEVYKYGVSKNKVNEYLYSGACTLYGFLYEDDAVALSGGGMMFKPYDATDLANKIEQVYLMPKEEREQFGINGRKYIKENYSVEVLADRLLEVLSGD